MARPAALRYSSPTSRPVEKIPGETMKIAKSPAVLAAALALGIVAPAASHHSHTMFDHTKEVTITGTVTQFVFRNPHVFLYVDAKGEDGGTVNYWIEMSNI